MESGPGNFYRVYLLRFWSEEKGSRGGWRFSLDEPHTRAKRGFANLDELVAFIEAQTSNRQTGGNLNELD